VLVIQAIGLMARHLKTRKSLQPYPSPRGIKIHCKLLRSLVAVNSNKIGLSMAACQRCAHVQQEPSLSPNFLPFFFTLRDGCAHAHGSSIDSSTDYPKGGGAGFMLIGFKV